MDGKSQVQKQNTEKRERFMLKPITFNVVGANVQLSIIDCIPIAFIIIAVATFCLSMYTKNDLKKKNLLIEKSITLVKRSIIAKMAIFTFYVFILFDHAFKILVNQRLQKTQDVETDTKLKKLLTCKLNNDIIYMQKRTRSNIPVP